jgi:tRNA nucleotidyltransferase (CCA-adding enzyme)
MENAVRMQLFGRLSGRRLFRELVLCLSEEKPMAVLKRLGDYGLLNFFHPSLKVDRALEGRFQRLEGVVSWYRLLFTGEKFEPWVVAFLGLVESLSEKEVEGLLTRFSLPEKFRLGFIQRRRMALQVVGRLAVSPPLARSDLFHLLNPLPTDFLLYGMGRVDSEAVKKAISLYFTELKRIKVSLGGQDLRRMGYVPGPIYSEILQAILRARLDGKLLSRQEEVDFVRMKFPLFQGITEKKRGAPAGKKRGEKQGEKTSVG